MGLGGLIALGDGELERALELLAACALTGLEHQGASNDGTRLAWPDAVGAALALGRLDDAQDLVDSIADLPRGLVPPLLRAELSRARALLASARDRPDEVEAGLRSAIEGLAELGYPFWLARAQTDLGEWLTAHGRRDEAAPLLEDAIATLEELGAQPALARARDAISPAARSL